MIEITSEQHALIASTLKKYLPTAEVIAFGSRVEGSAKKYSDLDLAIKDETKIPLSVWSNLEEELAETDLPFKVDIVDWSRTSEEFQKIIETTGKKFPL